MIGGKHLKTVSNYGGTQIADPTSLVLHCTTERFCCSGDVTETVSATTDPNKRTSRSQKLAF